MSVVQERMYRFALATQWAAGARRNLELRGDRLVVPDELGLVPIAGAGRAEGGALPAVDPHDVLRWLRPSRRLVRRPLPGTSGVVDCGPLAGPASPRRLVCGRSLVWVLTEHGALDRYAAATMQRLTPVVAVAGWRTTDATDDGGDGVWLAEVDRAGRWQLRHVDCWGRTYRPPIPVPGRVGGQPVIAAAAAGARVVILDPVASSTAYVVDQATGDVAAVALDPAHGAGPTLLTAAHGDRMHLLTAVADGRALYQAVSLTGSVENHHEIDVPRVLGRPTGLVGGPDGLFVAGTRGLADLAARTGPTGERTSTFITPALVSPPGSPSGWNRAEIDVVIPSGTAMDVTWAAPDDAWLNEQATRLLAGPTPSDLVDRLNKLLPWRDDQTVTYRGDTNPSTQERLAVLLDQIPEGTLWLRVRLRTPSGRTPPVIVALRVRYPDLSYLDHLPAIYREDPRASAELRRILAPYELLFDELDEELAALPTGIDPASAGDDRTDYLLSWLGFPPLGDLPAPRRRTLLGRAAELLSLRGTRRGLELLLDLVTDGRATVTDSADGPAAWFLGPGGGSSVGAAPARLGVDTVSLAQRPPPARTGGLVLGRTPLGRGCPDPGLLLAENAANISITVESTADQGAALEPVIERLLPTFVPAHCHVRLVRARMGAADRSRRLDADLRLGSEDATPGPGPFDARLHSDAHWRLGATTVLDGWVLAEPLARPAVLDVNTHSAQQRLH